LKHEDTKFKDFKVKCKDNQLFKEFKEKLWIEGIKLKKLPIELEYSDNKITFTTLSFLEKLYEGKIKEFFEWEFEK